MHIGVMLPNWIGDVVMATPTLRAIRHGFPQARITGVMRPYVAEVLAGTDWLDQQVLLDRNSKTPSLRTAAVARQLRAERVDTIILLPNSLSSAWLAWRSGAVRRLGYARNLRSPLLTERTQPPRSGGRYLPISAVDYYLELARRLGCSAPSRSLELSVTEAEAVGAAAIWKKHGWTDRTRVLALSNGGAYGAAKCWPDGQFAELARTAAAGDLSVLVVCGPNERDSAARIQQLAGTNRVQSLADEQVSIGLTKACLQRATAVVATDSGPRHMAAALGVPLVSLFGPTDPRWSLTYHSKEVMLRQPVDCGPCAKRVCPLEHHRCMRDITSQRVWLAVEQALSRSSINAA